MFPLFLLFFHTRALSEEVNFGFQFTLSSRRRTVPQLPNFMDAVSLMIQTVAVQM